MRDSGRDQEKHRRGPCSARYRRQILEDREARHAGAKGIVTMHLHADLLLWFRCGPGYQTRINAILRAYMQANESVTIGKCATKQ